MVRLFRDGRNALGLRRLGWLAATPPSTGEMEGVEASRDATEELACARRYAAECSRMGGVFQRLLAYVRLTGARPRPAQRPLAATRPARMSARPPSPAPGCLPHRRKSAR